MSEARTLSEIKILLVEDNPGDVRLTSEALKERRLPSELINVADGVEALRYLRREGDYSSNPMPDLILLDLNLPRKDGNEVLKEIKSDPALRRIPVIVLSSSRDAEDITSTYESQANCYVTKPANFADFVHVMQMIEDFWLRTASLPRNGDP